MPTNRAFLEYVSFILFIAALPSKATEHSHHYIHRPNLAASLPTDFLVLQTAVPSVFTVLQASSHVLRIARQTTITRKPQALLKPRKSSYDPTEPPHLHAFNAGSLWRRNYTGAQVDIAVFDTGIARTAHFPTIRTITDWTQDNTTDDSVGHGTFVASLIAGRNPACPGLAPHANLHIFKVFTGTQISYTSWFLDAFNYALHMDIDILNLSIGGPDFVDLPFVEKINELTASGIIIVSAIGNDGPLWGTLNNPADMMDVVGVAGAEPDATLASFSSRGMTMHEHDTHHPRYGRVKPDLVAYARSLTASSHRPPSCTRLSGTSVASPVVAAAIALLISSVPLEERARVINPASVKIALTSSAARLRIGSVYEQGAGLLRIEQAFAQLTKLRHQFADVPKLSERRSSETVDGPKAGFFPPFFDLTEKGCPYMWPHCVQRIFRGGKPITLNVTILNPASVEGVVHSFKWESSDGGKLLHVDITPPKRFWPWSAGLGIHLSAAANPNSPTVVEGILRMRVVSVHEMTHSDVELPIKATVIPTPPRSKRLLWDTFHSVQYPPGYVPRDNLGDSKDMLDWLGDHPHTNFHALYRAFISSGFHIDILDHSLECLDEQSASQYGALLLLDSEEFFSPAERTKLEAMVKQHGLALIVAAEWYNADIMQDIRFEDDNTRSLWTPIIGGANIPALNFLLRPYGVGFGDAVISGNLKTTHDTFHFESGAPIVRFPAGGELLYVSNLKVQESKRSKSLKQLIPQGIQSAPVFGITKSGDGAVLVYGDTNCIDTAFGGSKCFDFFAHAVEHTISRCAGQRYCQRLLEQSMRLASELSPSSTALRRMATPLPVGVLELFLPHSKVLREASSPGYTLLDRTFVQDTFVSQRCSERYNEQVRAQVRTVESLHVELPAFDFAQAVGSESKYYEEYGPWRWRRWDNSGWKDTNSIPAGWLVGMDVHARWQSLGFFTTALGLLSVSLLFRRRRGKRLRQRRLDASKRHALKRRKTQTAGRLMCRVGAKG
ncbi:Subtilisin-like protease SBT6.1 [Gracilariopsis chorda]|uniref:Subtilisin-like protease SBT6.1 n=1 Tax=Gracilariopsis chorda TaxID=448386 RepID=A0A2V3IRX3_9FLOR|nr:Subtilisin-like protease SBT6.1 [Gracilariopsis chorda]|eukprot:PXF44477.1 Subtilisin-like protease SBT6.1 [Gracilariopsis chorda]